MHQRDYILRIIEQFGAVLAEIRRLILGRGDPGSVRRALAGVAEQTGMDVELLRVLTLETLHLSVAPTGEVEPARCWLMAEILYLDGLHATLTEQDEIGRASLLKARALYDLIRPAGGMLVGFPEASARIDEIDRLLAPDERAHGRGRPRRMRAGWRARRPLPQSS